MICRLRTYIQVSLLSSWGSIENKVKLGNRIQIQCLFNKFSYSFATIQTSTKIEMALALNLSRQRLRDCALYTRNSKAIIMMFQFFDVQ